MITTTTTITTRRMPEISYEHHCSASSFESDRFRCTLTGKTMRNPVSAPCCGCNFERRSIRRRLQRHGNVCPAPCCYRPLSAADLKPNDMLQWEILYWQRRHGDAAAATTEASESSFIASAPIRTEPVLLPSLSTRTLDSVATAPLSRSNSKRDLPPSMVSRSPETANGLRVPSMFDTPPAVPKRKSSESDLTELYKRACHSKNASLGDACWTKNASTRSAPSSIGRGLSSSIFMTDILRSLAMVDTPITPPQRPEEPMRAAGILSVLEEVELSLGLDGL